MKNNLLPHIKKIDWEYLVKRPEVILMASLTDDGYALLSHTTGLPLKIKYVMRLADGEVFHRKAELEAMRAIFKKRNMSDWRAFKKRLLMYVSALDTISATLEKTHFTTCSHSELAAHTKYFVHVALCAQNFLTVVPVVDGVLAEYIRDALPTASTEQKQQWLSGLVYPYKENYHIAEELNFYRLARSYMRHDARFEKLLDAHLKKYAWIGTRWYQWEHAWKRDDITLRLKEFIAQHKNPSGEIRRVALCTKKRAYNARALMKQLRITSASALYTFIILAREFAYLRTYRTDVIYRAGYRARYLFHEIAKRAHCTLDDMAYLTYKELILCAQKIALPITHKELALRKSAHATILLDGHYRVLSGALWAKRMQSLAPTVNAPHTITGKTGFPGVIKGTVKVVHTSNDIHKVKRGDILVAVMTFPNLIPAMEKAAAFVTDEGGILCHAAIISREMQKPCVIATKIATQVLKDGDMVEVNATTGKVRVIEKKY